AALLEDHGEALTLGLGLVEILAQVEERELKPSLAVGPLLLAQRLDPRRLRADGRRQIVGGHHAGMCEQCQRHQQRCRKAIRAKDDNWQASLWRAGRRLTPWGEGSQNFAARNGQ